MEIDLHAVSKKLYRTSLIKKTIFNLMKKGRKIALVSGLILPKVSLQLSWPPNQKTQVVFSNQGFPQEACRQFLSFKETLVMPSLLGMENLVILVCISVII